jgi:hypothetical protein
LENFVERLDAWIAIENPSEDLRIIVTEWVVARFDNPYTDVSRMPDFPNLWFRPIPGNPAFRAGCGLFLLDRRGRTTRQV